MLGSRKGVAKSRFRPGITDDRGSDCRSIRCGCRYRGGWVTTLLVALVWSVITMVIRPVLQLLTLPITIVTLGLFSFILNAVLFWAMTLIVPQFEVAGFFPALLGAIVLSILTWLIQKVF
jgi:putative membrane protein